MAIVKMQKFNLLTFLEDREKVLRSLQAFQQTELLSAQLYYEEENTGSLFSNLPQNPEIEAIEAKVTRANWVLSYLDEYLPKKSALSSMRENDEEVYSFEEIEEFASNFPWERNYQKIQGYYREQKKIELQRKEYLAEEENLTIWQYFDETPLVFNDFEYAYGILGTLPNSQVEALERDLKQAEYGYYEMVYQSATTTYLYGLTHQTKRKNLMDVLKKNGFDPYHYPFKDKPKIELSLLKERLSNLQEREKEIRRELSTMNDMYHNFQIIVEHLQNQLLREQSSELFLKSKNILSIAGWVPAEEEEKLITYLEKAVGSTYFIEFKEVKEDNIKDVPILLRNNKFISPFESIVNMYSLPQYNEVDPTILLSPFYLVFFGMMVADAGYGLVLLIAATAGKALFNFKPGLKKNIDLFQILSVPTIVWGLIYGTFFGFEMPFQLLSITNDVNTILVSSVIFGVLQILFGLGVKFYIQWKKWKQPLHAVLQSGSWMLLLISVAVMLLGQMILSEPILFLAGAVGTVISLLGVMIGNGLDSTSIGGKIGNGLYGLLDVTNYLGDIISYTRLMALGIASGSIASAFNLIIDFMPPLAKFTVGIVLFILLHGLNIFLSYLSGYVHGIRLVYLEFFGKFYTGGGRAFHPFKSLELPKRLKNDDKKTP